MTKQSWLAIPVTVALVVVALLGMQAVGGFGMAAAQTPAEAQALPRIITVVGEGKVTTEPDVVLATVGVDVEAATVQEATSEASDRMESIMAALAEQGVAERDIQTTSYSIYFERRDAARMAPSDEETTGPAGVYRVNNMVNVKIRDLDAVGEVVDAVVEAGANAIWGVNFALDDTSEVQSEARAEAVEDAAARAEELAELSNLTLGQILEVTEVIGSASPYLRSGVAASMPMMGGGGGGPISPGELEYTTQIQVTYEIQ